MKRQSLSARSDRADRSSSKLTRREFLKLSGALAGSAALSQTGEIIKWDTRDKRPATAQPNIILIVADSLRADHISANGYARTTTPNLDAWIATPGATFRNTHTTAPWTFPANAAIMTGYLPPMLGVPWFGSPAQLPAAVPTLAEYLHSAGYYTAGFVSAEYVRSRWGFARGFDHYDESLAIGHTTAESGLAAQINTAALQWLSSWTPDPRPPLFLFLYYFDPHTWYNPPAPYDTLYDPSYSGTIALPANYRDGQDVVGGLQIPNAADIQHLLALYDGEIKYWDDRLGELKTALQNQQITDNALIVVTADHGDMFGEHNKWTHANCLYEEVLRVPLLMRYSGVITAGQTVDSPVQNMDLMPTILDYAGLAVPPGLRARSVRPVLEGSTLTTRDLFSEMQGLPDDTHPFHWLTPQYELRAVKRDNWKYIQHVNHPANDELYQLNSSSVYEVDNRIASEPTKAEELRQALAAGYPRALALPYVGR